MTTTEERIFRELIRCAAKCDLISYMDLGILVGIHQRATVIPLAFVAGFCWGRGLPPLTSLVVKSGTTQPGDGYITALGSVEEDRKSVYKFDWSGASIPRLWQSKKGG